MRLYSRGQPGEHQTHLRTPRRALRLEDSAISVCSAYSWNMAGFEPVCSPTCGLLLGRCETARWPLLRIGGAYYVCDDFRKALNKHCEVWLLARVKRGNWANSNQWAASMPRGGTPSPEQDTGSTPDWNTGTPDLMKSEVPGAAWAGWLDRWRLLLLITFNFSLQMPRKKVNEGKIGNN